MIVIDASVAIKLISSEKGSEQAVGLFISHRENKQEITVPEFLFIEVANALTTKTASTNASIKNGLQILHRASFLLHKITEDNLIKAALQAKKYHTSVYDMLYAVIAKEQKTTLITADEKFVKAVSFPYVILLGE